MSGGIQQTAADEMLLNDSTVVPESDKHIEATGGVVANAVPGHGVVVIVACQQGVEIIKVIFCIVVTKVIGQT